MSRVAPCRRRKTGSPAVRVLIAATLVVAALDVRAGPTTFLPQLQVSESYTDNVGIGGTDNPEADWITAITLVLPWETSWRRGSTSVTYTPALVRNAEHPELDAENHGLIFRAAHETGPKLGFKFVLGLTQAQTAPNRQGFPTVEELEETPEIAPVFVSSYTEDRKIDVSASVGGRVGGTWTWAVDSGMTRSSSKEIASAEPTEPTEPGDPLPPGFDQLEDRTDYDGAISIRRDLNRSSNLGLKYGYSRLNLQVNGVNDVHRFSLVYQRKILSRISLDAGIGGLKLSTPEQDSGTGLTALLHLQQDFRRISLGISGSRDATTGGNLQGTSINTNIALLILGRVSPKWNVDGSVIWGTWDPQLADTEERITQGAGVNVEWALRKVHLRSGVQYLKREYFGPGGNLLTQISGEFTTAHVGMVWRMPGYRRGQKRTAR